MSPHDINVLLHHYSSTAQWPLGNTEAYRSSLEWMFHNGLCDRADMFARLTARGNALVRMLCATPLPEQRFINPLTNEAVEDAA